MALNVEFKELVMDKLQGMEGITFRSMFGGGGLFHDGRMFALIHEASLFMKVDDSNRDMFMKEGMDQFRPFPDKPMRMPYYGVPAEVLEDGEVLKEWARISMDVAHK
jgi:DNA transformation protein